MTPTTDQLKDLLAKVTPGEWRMGHRWQSIIADGETGNDDYDNIKAYGGHLVCESVAMPANATLIALAPTLAAEVVRLRHLVNNAKRILNREAILALPSEYDEDEQWMIDEFSMRVGLESCRECVREARQALDANSEK